MNNFFSMKNSMPENVIRRYKAKNKIKNVLLKLFRLLILLSLGYVVFYPLMYMLTSSIRTGESYYDPTITWITTKVTMENFKISFSVMNYLNSFKNTVVYELLTAIIQLCSCAVAAYGFARFNFKEKGFLIGVLYLTILLPAQATMLPNYINYSHLDVLGILGQFYKLTGLDLRINILNTPFVFYFPAIFGVGLRSGIIIFIFMQFFKGLPKELEEAAAIDGSNAFGTFLRIALPSSSVVIFTNLIFSVIWHWNDFYLAAMYLKDRNNFTLAVSLAEIKNSLEQLRLTWQVNNPAVGSMVMAACVLYVVPVLIMYIFSQKKFVKSIDRVVITG